MLLGDRLVADVRDDLVGQRQRVAHAAAGLAHEQPHRPGVDRELLLHEDAREVRGEPRRWHELEVVALAARQDRVRELVRLGRREHERHVRRRLLERLQQRVEGLGREHVDFVDDVDLLAQHGGLVPHRLRELADRIDAAIRGAIHLEVVDGAALVDRVAGRAGVARPLRRVRREAVQRLPDDPCERGLAAAAGAAEQERVMDAPRRERVAERARDVLLPDNLAECRRAVLTCEDEVRHRALGTIPAGSRPTT